MRTITKVDNWERRDLYNFYKGFDKPIFNISVKKNASKLYKYTHRKHEFFLMSLYAIVDAVNRTSEMKMRTLEDGTIILFDKVDVVTPIMTEMNTFVEVTLPYAPNFKEFKEKAAPIIEAAKKSGKAYAGDNALDRVLVSCVPWIHFEGYTCPDYSFDQEMPIITYGKMEKGLVPINLKSSHVFMDGYHVAQLFDRIEENFKNFKNL